MIPKLTNSKYKLKSSKIKKNILKPIIICKNLKHETQLNTKSKKNIDISLTCQTYYISQKDSIILDFYAH